MYGPLKFPISHNEAVLTLGISEQSTILKEASAKLTDYQNSPDLRVRCLKFFFEEIAFATWIKLDNKDSFKVIFPVISDFTLALLFPDTRIEKDKSIMKLQTYKEWVKLDRQFNKLIAQLKKSENTFLPTAELISFSGQSQKRIESYFESAIKRQKQKNSWSRFIEDLLPTLEVSTAEKLILFFYDLIGEIPFDYEDIEAGKIVSVSIPLREGKMAIKRESLKEIFRQYRRERNLPKYQRGRPQKNNP